jgi:monoamine oxidase
MMARATGRRILVLGAGMAGLGAADVLARAGAEVVVIEARDRIGGRTHTSHLWPDLPVDMGASWIHGTKGNPVTRLARTVGLRITPTSYSRSATFDAAGRPVDFDKAARRAMKLVDRAREAVDDLDADVSLEAAVTGFPAWQALAPADRAIYRLAINTRIEHEYSGDWSRLSAWHFDDGDDWPGDESVVTPGFGAVLSHLAQGIDIRLGEAVTSVAPSGKGVTVTTTRGVHEGDCAIVTLPLGVLQAGDIRFAEPLDRKRQRAIDGLAMGLLNKCVLRFDRVFWPADADWIDFLSPAETLWGDWTSYLGATGQPLIVGFNAARTADEIEALDDDATTASALSALRAMFGSAVPAPVGSQVSRWRQDPFARGSYSFKAVGTSKKDRKALFGADWDGRLHFAGEATSRDHPATVHGALMTGQAAARAALGSP